MDEKEERKNLDAIFLLGMAPIDVKGEELSPKQQTFKVLLYQILYGNHHLIKC